MLLLPTQPLSGTLEIQASSAEHGPWPKQGADRPLISMVGAVGIEPTTSPV
jgi:hypothetical protein